MRPASWHLPSGCRFSCFSPRSDRQNHCALLNCARWRLPLIGYIGRKPVLFSGDIFEIFKEPAYCGRGNGRRNRLSWFGRAREGKAERACKGKETRKRKEGCKRNETCKSKKGRTRRPRADADFPAEFDEIREYEIRQKLRPCKGTRRERSGNRTAKWRKNRGKRFGTGTTGNTEHVREKPRPPKGLIPVRTKQTAGEKHPPKKAARTQEPAYSYINPAAGYFPITKIENGIIYTKDHRYIKVVEVVPINFMLRSAREQRSIIYSFISYLKISPVKLQFKVLTRRADITRHMDAVRCEMAQETNEQCRLMQEDYLQFVQQVGAREAVTRRFFLCF